MPGNPNQKNAIKKTLSWLNQDGFLKKKAILDWIFSLLDSAFDLLPKLDNGYGVSRKRNGPAYTIFVEFADSETSKLNTFSIDIVPAIRIDVKSDEDLWPSDVQIDDRFCKIKWHAIPKPDHTLVPENDCEWITSYADLERMLIDDRNNLKYVIRLFKVVF